MYWRLLIRRNYPTKLHFHCPTPTEEVAPVTRLSYSLGGFSYDDKQYKQTNKQQARGERLHTYFDYLD
jgi:hypothetical protein